MISVSCLAILIKNKDFKHRKRLRIKKAALSKVFLRFIVQDSKHEAFDEKTVSQRQVQRF